MVRCSDDGSREPEIEMPERSRGSRIRYRFRYAMQPVIALLGVLFLSGCIGVEADLSLSTDLNPLGGGRHEMIIALPAEYYSLDLLSGVPDFSQIDGVKQEPYYGPEGRGILVSQSFYRLGELNDPEQAIFLNQAFPDQPLAYRAKWEPGLLTRGLHLRIGVNAYNSRSLQEALAGMALSAITGHYTLIMPGPISAYNGVLQDERTVQWSFQLDQPQMLEATAQVPNYPVWAALAFSVVGLAFGATGVWQAKRAPVPAQGQTRPGRSLPRRAGRRQVPRPRRRP